jgi:3-deoxy-manno-octulosonate cytidylyltransferase (CMP-KDO synthetase)
VEPEALRSIAAGVGGPFGIATGAAPLPDEEAGNPSRVKVSCGRDGAAIEFSRRPLVAPGHHRVHVGVYAFRNDVLQRIVTLPEHPDEVAERLEQLRWLRAGEAIRVVPVNAPAPAVDTPEDLERVRAILASNAERG